MCWDATLADDCPVWLESARAELRMVEDTLAGGDKQVSGRDGSAFGRTSRACVLGILVSAWLDEDGSKAC